MKRLLILLWPISLVLAYQSGLYFARLPLNNVQSNPQVEIDSESNTNLPKPLTDDSHAAELSDKNPKLSKENHRLTVIEVVDQYKQLQGSGSLFSNNLAQMAELYQLFNNVPDDEILDLLEAMPIDESNKNFMTAYGYLLGRYAKSSGEDALLFLRSSELNKMSQASFQSYVYSAWAEVDSEVAFEHFINSPDSQKGRFKSMVLMGMLNVIAEQDLDLAIDKLTILNERGQETSMAVMGLSANFTESYQYQDLMTKLSSLGDDRLIRDTVTMWGSKQPSEAAQWLNDTANIDNKPQLAERVLSSWAMTDFEQAADWYVSSNFEQKEKQQLITKIIRDTHYRQDPTTLEGWVNKQDDIDKNLAVSGLIVNSAYQAPDYAEENIEKIVDEKEKIRVAHSIYTSYLRQNKHKAEQYRENSPYKDEIDKQIEQMKSYRKKFDS